MIIKLKNKGGKLNTMNYLLWVCSKREQRNIAELLRPFKETYDDNVYIKYTKDQAIQHARKMINVYKADIYDKFTEDEDSYKRNHQNEARHINFLKNQFPKMLKWTDDECYQYMCESFPKNMIDENGNLLSTGNPNGKFDSYTISWKIMTSTGSLVVSTTLKTIDINKTYIPDSILTIDDIWHSRTEYTNNQWMDLIKSLKSNHQNMVVTSVVYTK